MQVPQCGLRSYTLASCLGPLFVHWVTWKAPGVSPGSPRSEFWGVAVLEGSGWCQEEWGETWSGWCTSHCLFWALRQARSLWPLTPGYVPPQVLFALCSLLRHFPYAQQQFLKLGGLQVLRSLVQEKGTQVLAVRVVTLLYDLVTEKVSAWACPASPHFALCLLLSI